MMINKKSLTVIQLNDRHAYFDLHQEMFWQGDKTVYRSAGGYARINKGSLGICIQPCGLQRVRSRIKLSDACDQLKNKWNK